MRPSRRAHERAPQDEEFSTKLLILRRPRSGPRRTHRRSQTHPELTLEMSARRKPLSARMESRRRRMTSGCFREDRQPEPSLGRWLRETYPRRSGNKTRRFQRPKLSRPELILTPQTAPIMLAPGSTGRGVGRRPDGLSGVDEREGLSAVLSQGAPRVGSEQVRLSRDEAPAPWVGGSGQQARGGYSRGPGLGLAALARPSGANETG